MQDAERLQEQVDEMIAKAEIHAEIAGQHCETVVQQRNSANRDLAKFKFLHEIFTVGQNLMNQRKNTFLSAETPPEPHILEGLQGALEELGRISRQAQDAVQRLDGSQAALQSLEEAFRAETVQATSRARGLAVQGQRAVDVAKSRTGEIDDSVENTETPVIAAAAAEVPGLLDSLQRISDAEDSAKEPIAVP